MDKFALFIFGLLICACVIVNAQESVNPNKEQIYGQSFDEIVVSSDLNVRRKLKDNRQGKQLLTNVPSGTTGEPGKPTVSRLISSDGSRVVPEKRLRRETMLKKRSARSRDMGSQTSRTTDSTLRILRRAISRERSLLRKNLVKLFYSESYQLHIWLDLGVARHLLHARK